MKLTSEEINEQLEKFNQAKNEFISVVKRVQVSCKHEHIAEHEIGTISPPLRVCLCCGLTEEGWGCGFLVLLNKTELGVPSIDRDRFLELRQGYFLTEPYKSMLRRKEITLTDLILGEK